MRGSDYIDMELREKLKQLIIDECDKDIDIKEVGDDDELFSPNHPLRLDSLDVLQISIALQNEYQIKLTDPKKIRKIMLSINTLATYIESK